MDIKNIEITLLKPADYNPRKKLKKSDKEYIKIKNSIEKFGYIDPIIINKDFTVIGGHQRLTVLKDLKFKNIDCVIVDVSKEEEKALNIALNKITGDWDKDLLRDLFLDLKLTDIDLDLTGFDNIEISDIIGEELKAEDDNFEVPNENEIKTDIVLGDLFEIGEHRLLCGDSTNQKDVEMLMNGEKADMVFTSPPYNGNTSASRDEKAKLKGLYLNNGTDNKTSENYITFNADIFSNIKINLNENGVLMYNINYNNNSPNEYINVVKKGMELFNLVETIVWKKQLAVSLAGDNLTRIYEFIFLFYNSNGKPKINKEYNECIKNLWEISNIGANSENHKACFPIELVAQAINYYAIENAILFEPFTGSGTTMVASHQLKRKCYGMELDPRYCQVIIDRMKKLDPNLIIKKNGLIYG